jgi:uncharacterized membrane protein YqaE (UPF0057 family)
VSSHCAIANVVAEATTVPGDITSGHGDEDSSGAIGAAERWVGDHMVKVLLVLLCLVLPFVAVFIKEGPSLKVLWAFLLQLCGHVPGVIYGIYQVVKD